MTVGIVGLGLIGGSFARAYALEGHEVLAYNRTVSVTEFAMLSGAVHGHLTEENIHTCDLLLLCLYPQASVDYLGEMAPKIQKNCLVLDCDGTKRAVCEAAFPIAQRYGFTFVGGHPMAGTHFSGFKYSRANLFEGAPMVIVPPVFDDIDLLQRVKDALAPCHFGSFSVTTAKEHDAIIAFTSQMPHIVSNAFIKSPTALAHKGFSAGSYKDLTRVAWLNAPMWAELFLENGDHLVGELDTLIADLQKYRDAIAAQDRDALTALLQEGRERKEQVDG